MSNYDKDCGIEQFVIWAAYRGEGKNASIESLTENVNALCRVATQKTGGQKKYAKQGDLPVEMIQPIRFGIVTGAIALVLSGTLDDLPEDDPLIERPKLDGASSHWAFLMKGGQKSNVNTLIDAVDRLGAIVRHNAYDSHETAYERLKWVITGEATALVLSGKLDEIKVNSDSAKRHCIPNDFPLPVEPYNPSTVCEAVTLTKEEKITIATKLAKAEYELSIGIGSLVEPELTEKEQAYLDALLLTNIQGE